MARACHRTVGYCLGARPRECSPPGRLIMPIEPWLAHRQVHWRSVQPIGDQNLCPIRNTKQALALGVWFLGLDERAVVRAYPIK
jgi:hypothetical protein